MNTRAILSWTLFSLISTGLAVWSSPIVGQTISAYTYTTTGSGGISSLASKTPSQVDNVYLDAIDIDVNGKVYVKNSGGHFYPYYWQAKKPPSFTAMISVDPTLNWQSVDPTADLLNGLQQNSWKTDYGQGIHIDAEFTADVQAMPQNWVNCLKALREYTNQQGRDFSMYYNPKYLSSSRYTNAKANADAIAAILGAPSGGLSNQVFFPVYEGNGLNTDLATLHFAAEAARARALDYQWIHDLSESPTTFSDGLTMAKQTDSKYQFTPSGVNVYSYFDNQPVTSDMTTNFNKLLGHLGNPNAVPEPASLFIWAWVGMGSLCLRRRRS
ncbi:MAG: hypothetical protein MK108_15030 [Mariniblastus sp.]|nr:hypothetical protein [Mariniblastus sp.]